MKTYKIRATFTFKGAFTVKANTRDEAIKKVSESCGMHGIPWSRLPLGEVDDFHFPPAHSEKTVLRHKHDHE